MMNFFIFLKKIWKESTQKKNLKLLSYAAFIDLLFFTALFFLTTKHFAPKLQTVFSGLGTINPQTLLQVDIAQQSAELVLKVFVDAIFVVLLYTFIVFVLMGIKNVFIYAKLQKFPFEKKHFFRFIFFNILVGLLFVFLVFFLAATAKNEHALAILYALFFTLLFYFSVLIQCYLAKEKIGKSIKKGLLLGFKHLHYFFGLYLILSIVIIAILNTITFLGRSTPQLAGLLITIILFIFFEWLRIVSLYAVYDCKKI